jgi:flagellar motor switch protein FliG
MPDEMTGLRKAAVLLLMLGTKNAADVLARCNLRMSDLERLAGEVAGLRDVPAPVRKAVADEFTGLSNTGFIEARGADFAKELLSLVLGDEKGATMLSRFEAREATAPFIALGDMPVKDLVEVVKDEQPQVISIVLRHLPRKAGAELLSGLTEEQRTQVVLSFVKGGDPTADATKVVGQALLQKASTIGGWDGKPKPEEAVAGPRALVEILNNADLEVEKSVLDSLSAIDPELGNEVRESMFVFEDLPHLDPRALQLVLREVDPSDLTLSIKGTTEDVRKIIFDNLSENAAAGVKEDLETLGPVRRRDIMKAHQNVVNVVRKMAEEGKVNIRNTTEETDEMVA